MDSIIETKRLYLRPLQVADAPHFYALNEDPDVLKYTGDVPFENVTKAEEFLQNYTQYKKFGVGRWAVIQKVTGAFLGWCGLKFAESTKEYDIGFRFFKTHWNKGYATEAADACIDYGLNTLQIPRIIGSAMKQNSASVKVLEKIGLSYLQDFTFEGQHGAIYVIT